MHTNPVLRKWMLAVSLIASAFSSSALGQAQLVSKTKIVDNIYQYYCCVSAQQP